MAVEYLLNQDKNQKRCKQVFLFFKRKKALIFYTRRL